MERIAIIIVNYNGINDSIECIKSLKMSSYREISIIFVDNNSENDEASIIESRYPDVIVIRSKINNGFSYGNNLGIIYALKHNYQYIMLLNNDTVVAKDMIELLKEKCTNDFVTTPKIYYFYKPQTIWYGGGNINRMAGNGCHISKGKIDLGNGDDKYCTFASGCCIMLKSDIFRKVGLLNEDYFMYFEDVEFCIQLAKNNIGIRYVPSAKMWHKVGGSGGGEISVISNYYMTRNRLNCVKKYKSYFFVTAYPFSLLSRIYRMMFCRDKKIRLSYLRAITDHMANISGKIDIQDNDHHE